MTYLDFDPQDNSFLNHLSDIGDEDAEGLIKAQKSYGNSWKQRGGVGAFMMLARKWDRLENRVAHGKPPQDDGWPVSQYDVFRHVLFDEDGGEGIIDDIRDLRRYLMLVEAELRARGFRAEHRDNQE